MILTDHITNLLYRYECVIVPNFGGFVTNRIGASFNTKTQQLHAPCKQLSFNNFLNKNDGLLVNYIATSEDISFDKATQLIETTVKNWQEQLQKQPVVIGNLGVLTLNKDQKINFEPNTETNFLASSFGLTTLNTNAVNKPRVLKNTPKTKQTIYLKYAAAAALFLASSTALYNTFNATQEQNTFTAQKQSLEKKIQNATFVIPNPLPTLELEITKANTNTYHVVAGAFKFKENAVKKVKQLQKKGFNAKIIGVNKWGLTQVVYNSYTSKRDAINGLNKIKKTTSKDAWLLVSK